jgi:hypothetical protein
MRNLVLRASVLGLLAVFSQSCILSRLTDRAFVGFHVKHPTYSDRKVTGLVLLPITFAIDAATFPIQVILLAIVGDDFILGKDTSQDDNYRPMPHYVENLKTNPQFQRLTEQQQAVAIAEFEKLFTEGTLDPSAALGLTEDGHWVQVPLTDEARAQLLERAKSAHAPQALALCAP